MKVGARSHDLPTQKFKVLPYIYNETQYFILFDVLGLFLSSLAHAPAGAMKGNFYLLLTTTYAS